MGSAVAFSLDGLESDRVRANRRYHEFLRVPSLSGGLYALRAGESDPQSPHGEDEVYVVLRGRARFRVGMEDHPISAGSVIYVPARVEHRFHDIQEDLSVLVLFAPAEGTAPGPPEPRA